MLNVILGIFIALIFIGGLNYFLTKNSVKKAAHNHSGTHNHKSGGHGCCH